MVVKLPALAPQRIPQTLAGDALDYFLIIQIFQIDHVVLCQSKTEQRFDQGVIGLSDNGTVCGQSFSPRS